MSETQQKTQPLCPVFGECGGCFYQDIPYTQELQIKERQLKNLLQLKLDLKDEIFDPIVSSPEAYHYRNRLDLNLSRTKTRGLSLGFSPQNRRNVVEIDSCAIARKEISNFIPRLRDEAVAKLPSDYSQANLVVRTGDDGRVLWGGIGRRSLCLKEEDYFWTEIQGKKIYYSLETFFQANLSILPKVLEYLQSLDIWSKVTTFFDLYAGVGLFGICLADRVHNVFLVEECKSSIKLSQYNVRVHQLKNIEIAAGTVEARLPALLEQSKDFFNVAMIDPPRAGLSLKALLLLSQTRNLNKILYLSCNPETLARDLEEFVNNDWKIEKAVPFDFFPKTKHLEVLVILKNIENKGNHAAR